MRRALAALLLAAGCGSPASPITVTLRVPAGSAPLALADALSLSLRDSAGDALAVRRAPVDAASLALDAVPAGSGYVVELDATLGTDVVARGRSCPFDLVAGQPAPAVPIYFSAVGVFAPSASNPAVARSGAVAFPVGAGAILAGGAAAGGSPLASSERYDHAVGRFTDGPELSRPRAGAESALLPDGTALVFGGADPDAAGVDAFAAGRFAAAPAAFPSDLTDEASVLLGDGRVLAAGGRTSVSAPLPAAYLLSLDGAMAEPAGALIRARRLHTLTLAGTARDSAAFAVGGVDASGPVADLEVFDPSSDGFALADAQLTTPRSEHTVTRLDDGRLLIVGGRDANGGVLASAELFDPIRRTVSGTGRLRLARARHVAVALPSGRVLIAGGLDASGAPTAAAELFDPALGAAGDFVPTAPMTVPRAGHVVAPLCDGTYLIAGGGAGAEIYNPIP